MAILKRTKHLLSSPHLPLRLLVLDVIDASLVVVSKFENDLLPMIHQNWDGLVRRFDDSQLVVRAKAVQVIF